MSLRSPESNRSREKALAIEFAYTGDPDLLLTFAKHAQIPRNPGDHSRWIVLPGGGVRGALQAGLMTSAVETKFFYGATDAVAYSVGAAVLLNGAALNPTSEEIFYDDNFLGEGFIGFSPKRLAKLNIVDFKGLEVSFRKRHPMNIDALRRCPVTLQVAVTAREGEEAGKTKFVDVRNEDDPYKHMMASMSLPQIGNIPGTTMEVNGKMIQYNDCLVTTGDILTHAINSGARDILFIVNEKFTKGRAKRFWARVQDEVGKRQKDPFWRAMLTAPRREIVDMEEALKGQIVLKDGTVVRVGVLGPTENRIKFMDRNRFNLRRAVFDGHDDGMNRFGSVMDQAEELLKQGSVA